jgi:hypothetical protein
LHHPPGSRAKRHTHRVQTRIHDPRVRFTLASNFTAIAPVDQISAVLAEAAASAEPLKVRFGEQALFGLNLDVPVRLVDSEQAVNVHSRLAAQRQALPGFTAAEPAYWRDGYRPHLTLGPAIDPSPGRRAR